MTPNGRGFFACLALIGVGLMSFGAGRWTAPGRRGGETARTTIASASSNLAQSKPAAEIEARDSSAITIENLGEVDSEQAWALLRTAPKETLKQWTIRLQALPTSPHKAAGITAFFKALSQIDTALAVELASSMDRSEPRSTALSAVIKAAPLANLPALANLYRGAGPEDGDRFSFLGQWSLSDPARAAEFVASVPGDSEKYEIGVVASNWAAIDPGAARGWLETLAPERRDEEVMDSFYEGYLEHDQAAALNDLVRKAGDKNLIKAIAHAGGKLFVESPDAARSFIAQLPPAEQAAAVSEITGYVNGNVYSEDVEVKADGVAKWLLTLPDALWSEKVGRVVKAWAELDPQAYASWVGQMPSRIQNQIAADYCRSYDWRNPKASFEAGLGITEPGLRDETFREFFSKLGAAKARGLVKRAHLPEADAASLERIISQL